MPVSPEDTAAAAESVARVYREAEQAILGVIANQLGKGLDSPDWADRKLLAAGRVRRKAQALLARAEQDAAARSDSLVADAISKAVAAAVGEMRGFVANATGELRQELNLDRLNQIARAQVDHTQPPLTAVLRTVVDQYRQITADAAARAATGAITRRQAAQHALWQAAARGITSFTSRDGRRWDLASYMEMSLRTTGARATLNAHTEALAQLGHELVVVSNTPRECTLCRPWEGTVLWADNGPTGTIQRPSMRDGSPVRFHVAGTLLEARAAGLYHPNCRHQVSAYLPGVTTPPQDTADPEGEQAREKLRYLERQVRRWKKREAAALSEQARQQARAKVREYQGRIREHVDTTSAKRRTDREQINQAR